MTFINLKTEALFHPATLSVAFAFTLAASVAHANNNLESSFPFEKRDTSSLNAISRIPGDHIDLDNRLKAMKANAKNQPPHHLGKKQKYRMPHKAWLYKMGQS